MSNMSRSDVRLAPEKGPSLRLVSNSEAQPPVFLMRGTGEYKRASLALFLSGFATFSLLYCVQPLMPLFSQDFAVTPAESSLSLSLSTGFLAVAIFLAAAVSERFGRRSLMFASLMGAALCTIACAVVPNWHLLLFARALEGLLLGGVPAVAMSYLSEEIDPRGLGASMGLYIAGNAFGGMAGRVITGMLAELLNWKLALGVVGTMGLIAALGFFFLLPPSRNFVSRRGAGLGFHLKAWGGHLSDPALPFLFLIAGLLMGSFVTIYNYAGYRLVGAPYNLNQTELGLIFTVYIFGIAASWAGGLLGDRFGHFAILPIGIASAALGVAITLSSSLAAIIIGIVLLTIGFFMAHSVASSLVGRLAKRSKGHASSLYLLSYYVGSSVAGSVGGYFWAADGWWAVVAFTFALLAIAMICAYGAARLARR